jgi:hypothetical protein
MSGWRNHPLAGPDKRAYRTGGNDDRPALGTCPVRRLTRSWQLIARRAQGLLPGSRLYAQNDRIRCTQMNAKFWLPHVTVWELHSRLTGKPEVISHA